MAGNISELAIDPNDPLRWLAVGVRRLGGDFLLHGQLWSENGGVDWQDAGMSPFGAVYANAEFHSDGFVYSAFWYTRDSPRVTRIRYGPSLYQFALGPAFTDLSLRAVELLDGEKMMYGPTDCWLSSDRFATHTSCVDAVFSAASPDPHLKPARLSGPDQGLRVLIAGAGNGVLVWDNTARTWSVSNTAEEGIFSDGLELR